MVGGVYGLLVREREGTGGGAFHRGMLVGLGAPELTVLDGLASGSCLAARACRSACNRPLKGLSTRTVLLNWRTAAPSSGGTGGALSLPPLPALASPLSSRLPFRIGALLLPVRACRGLSLLGIGGALADNVWPPPFLYCSVLYCWLKLVLDLRRNVLRLRNRRMYRGSTVRCQDARF